MRPGLALVIFHANKRPAVYLGLGIFVIFVFLTANLQNEIMPVNFGFIMVLLSPLFLTLNTIQKDIIYHIVTHIRMKKHQMVCYSNINSTVLACILAFIAMIVVYIKKSISANNMSSSDNLKYFLFIFLYLVLISTIHNFLLEIFVSRILSFFIANLPIILEYISSSFPEEFRFIFAYQAVYEIFVHNNLNLYLFFLVLSQIALLLSTYNCREGVIS